MAGRRTVYLIALMGGVVFYWAYREWLSYFLLMAMLLLPWFSLILSLPAMLSCRAVAEGPEAVQLGTETELVWRGHCRLPLPALKGKLLVQHSVTGAKEKIGSGDWIAAEHCGMLQVRIHKPRCCDYLGVFALPIRDRAGISVLVRPVPVAPAQLPDLSRCRSSAWRPKPGGGFSENHELRLYRPGDNLHQVHWKLTAKTGKLIVREAMEPVRSRVLLTLELRGTGDEVDRKLGMTLWMSNYLLQNGLPHSICCLTGSGMELLPIGMEQDVQPAIDHLLRCPLADWDAAPEYMHADWRYHIGGDNGEA